MRGSRLRGAAAQLLGRLARLEQPPLGDGQTLVGASLRFLQPSDRRARFLLAPVERGALFFGLMLLARELLGFLRQPRVFVRGVLQLRVVADDDLLLLVLLGVERVNRIGGMRDRRVERRGLLRQLRQRFAIRGNAIAQLLDLALGLEDAARFGGAAAGHEMRTAEHVAFERRDWQRRRHGEPAHAAADRDARRRRVPRPASRVRRRRAPNRAASSRPSARSRSCAIASPRIARRWRSWRKETAELEATIAHAANAIAALNAEHHKQEKAVVGHEAQLQHATDEETRLAQKSEQLAREKHQAEEERDTLDRRQEEARASIGRLEEAQRRRTSG